MSAQMSINGNLQTGISGLTIWLLLSKNQGKSWLCRNPKEKQVVAPGALFYIVL